MYYLNTDKEKRDSQNVRRTSCRPYERECQTSALDEKSLHIRAEAQNGRARTSKTPEKTPSFCVACAYLAQRDSKQKQCLVACESALHERGEEDLERIWNENNQPNFL